MTQDQNLDQATVGRVLHFVVDNRHGPKCRPALVLDDWGGGGAVNLIVFPDGSNDGKYGIDDHTHEISLTSNPNCTQSANVPLSGRWETSVVPNHGVRAVRSWHWPRECGGLDLPADPYTDVGNIKLHHNHKDGIQDLHNCLACIRRASDIAHTTKA